MQRVSAKKSLGQHFLNDPEKAKQIVNLLSFPDGCRQVLEVGPGMGVLTDFLYEKKNLDVKIIDLDREAIQFLLTKYPTRIKDIIEGDFLKLDLQNIFEGDFIIIGNFPYNISSQILFRALDFRNSVVEIVGMFQKEVAARIASKPGGREYGILSVLMQTWYDVSLAMELNENDFTPPPKVKSAVLHFVRKTNFDFQCNEVLYRRVIKTAFNQRRKTLRNALSPLLPKEEMKNLPYLDLRAEALGWPEFRELTNMIEKLLTKK